MVLPSHLVRLYNAPDEDYKTLCPVMSLQRWAKSSEYPNFNANLLYSLYFHTK